MAWCRQATSHYLSQCWPRSMSPYGVIRPQWVNHEFRLSEVVLVLHMVTPGNVFVPGPSFRILDGLTNLPSESFMSYLYSQREYSTGGSRLCNWSPLTCLMPWINYMPPLCYSMFANLVLSKSCVCKFDIFFSFLILLYIYLYIIHML